MTDEEKRAAFKEGRYVFPPPSVPTVLWDEKAWIDFIDTHGHWLPEKKE